MTSNLLFNAMRRDMQTVILVMKLEDKKQLKKSCDFVGFHADDPSFDIFKVINKVHWHRQTNMKELKEHDKRDLIKQSENQSHAFFISKTFMSNAN